MQRRSGWRRGRKLIKGIGRIVKDVLKAVRSFIYCTVLYVASVVLQLMIFYFA
jgi:hypothetical protein